MKSILVLMVCCITVSAEASGWAITDNRVITTVQTTTVVRSTPTKTRTVVRSRWNVNGDWNPTETTTRRHLEQEHGVSTAGMSHQQMRDLHDSLHENRSRTVTRSVQCVQSNCPDGVCPSQTRRRR